MTKNTRRNTKLESEAAEFLVLGRLLLERILCYKSYVNYPGYDLIAVNPDKHTNAKIQVKSRYDTDWDGFIINNFKCDFVVFVALNRGLRRITRDGDKGIKEPECYVLPIDYVEERRDPRNKWGKITRNRLSDIELYLNRWKSIRNFLTAKRFGEGEAEPGEEVGSIIIARKSP